MNKIGLFEAKTKFSEICERVAREERIVIVTKRGKPLVEIAPVRERNPRKGVWAARKQWVKDHGPIREDFQLPVREKQTWRNPLED